MYGDKAGFLYFIDDYWIGSSERLKFLGRPVIIKRAYALDYENNIIKKQNSEIISKILERKFLEI